ncbi:STAS/SEC14 domain-containing protein [Actinoplanes sp. NPDC023714]|uniref:STAS/SEC14 domain-containing protein n=1 Tax=Actinoplanes sp. NPDC023714 TaxID=3154322 RepID=UPI003402A0F9
MIEQLDGLPAGALGFRFGGAVSREEYNDVFLPPTKAALDEGRRIRLLLLIEDDFGWFQPGAFWEDLKFGLGSAVGHHASWEKMALVSDADWVRHAMGLFGWMVPGEARVFPVSAFDESTIWLAK